jgi:CheY-like chemotaxis protein
MFEKEWPILLVDDDPDVLSVSTLAMKNFRVDGRPIKLFTATSKAEAIELLDTSLSGRFFPYLAMAFIDVVMETDTAGLELCEYIRESQHNRLTQLYIRTGQPGVAPEREVIDRYDINGYFTKVEMSESKLYSLVKAGVRQFDFTNEVFSTFELVTHAIGSSESIDDLKGLLVGALDEMPRDAHGKPTHDYQIQVCIIIGDQLLAAGGYTEAEALRERDRLLRLGPKELDSSGDAYVFDGNTFVVKVAATPSNDVAYHMARLAGPPNLPYVLLVRVFTRAIAALAKRASASPRQAAAVA